MTDQRTPEQRQAAEDWERIKKAHRLQGPCPKCMGAYTQSNRERVKAEHAQAEREARS